MSIRLEVLIDGLREVVSATTTEECVGRIEQQAERLWGAQAVLTLGESGIDAPAAGFELRARGRVLGRIAIVDEADDPLAAPEEIAAFVAHAAVALDNARRLEHQSLRARRDPLRGCSIRASFTRRSRPRSLSSAAARARS